MSYTRLITYPFIFMVTCGLVGSIQLTDSFGISASYAKKRKSKAPRSTKKPLGCRTAAPDHFRAEIPQNWTSKSRPDKHFSNKTPG